MIWRLRIYTTNWYSPFSPISRQTNVSSQVKTNFVQKMINSTSDNYLISTLHDVRYTAQDDIPYLWRSFLDPFSPSTPARSQLPATPSSLLLPILLALCPSFFYSSQASRQSRKMSVSFIITHPSALGSSFRVSVCVWRVAVGGKGKIRWEGEEEVKKDGWRGQHDSERWKGIDGFVIVEEEKIERRDGVDDESERKEYVTLQILRHIRRT